MNLQNFLTEVATTALSGVIILIAGYSLLKNDIQRYFKLRFASVRADENSQLLTLRLQAYERLTVFIERINPANLFLRLHQQGISVYDMQSNILNEIRSEYQHNVAQQLYINATTWKVISSLKDDTLAMVNNAVAGLPENSAGVDLSKKVLQHMAGMTDNPYDLTLNLIKKDIHQLF
ncbi:DUF7935 family protein [Pedobacter metabolipauper]|uniref:Uncharacterized protein n=1 Tax=Pedobacter metabolipauper TaxID=425513 RepID=A0A4R6SY19_9SPHI|nr:hypothetical protein [Pedobacter metabolipauper]TDQ10376.1 hypothetical protein ATK78_2542 [Pedobacter metabolipauper]